MFDLVRNAATAVESFPDAFVEGCRELGAAVRCVCAPSKGLARSLEGPPAPGELIFDEGDDLALP